MMSANPNNTVQQRDATQGDNPSTDGTSTSDKWVYDLQAVTPADSNQTDSDSDSSDGKKSSLLSSKQSLPIRIVRNCANLFTVVVSGIFGFLGIVFLMSVVATIPVVQFLSLGYLLEAGARVSRSGRLRDGFIGIAGFRRLAGICIVTYLMLLPIRVIADIRNSATLLETDGPRVVMLTSITAAIVVFALSHIAWSVYRGGRLRSFLWPRPIKFFRHVREHGIANMYVDARDRVWEHFVALRLPYYFWLGLRGFAVALAWLALPVTVLVVASRAPEVLALLLSFVGGVLLLTVLLYLPFLQVNFARTQSIREGFRWRAVRDQFKRAPIAFWLSLVATLVLAVPLYLLKAELIPREAAWLPSLVFMLSILPTRILTGWAIARAENHADVRFWLSRWAARLLALPIAAAYVLIVYLTQYTSWHGVWSLYEQHAFLLPVPFMGM